ncbi:G-protein coupled receptor [Biomphalaria pfeifferi]|uniref:G-protein coupled receptor n=1 Tax=Biomphalaria pfeifferi TaxID=112525 RepID=A0AAD8B6Z1_BIOPF|nr:G-protein coupled receptor [Biomphalaria pfeifferi]
MALNMTNLTSGQDTYNPCWTPLVSDFVVIMFLLINHVILSSCLCVTGIVANAINICVFLKQVLGTSTSITFFSLSVADLLGLVTLLWYVMCLNPYLANIDTEYSSAYYDWTFNVAKNKTVFGLVFRSNRPQTDGLSFLFHGSFTLISFFSVVTFTSVLELRRTSKWRHRAVNSGKQTATMSKRDRKKMIMVVLVATSLIVCFVPTVVLSIVTISVSEFSVVGKEVNLFNTGWSFGFLLHSVNSNVHFILYYKMSSKFRSTYQSLFRRPADTVDTHDTHWDDPI